MKCSLILTANAGVLLSAGGKELLLDALHNEKVPGFSAVPQEVLTSVWTRFAINAPSAVLATHNHKDHVSLSLWETARRRWPSCAFLSPGAPLGGTVVLEEPRQHISLAGISIEAMRLPHDGSGFESVVNYGYFLDIGGFTVLIPGDCAVTASAALSELVAGRHVDLALLNFPWVTLSKPGVFVRGVLAPSHLVLFHLPFSQDDQGGYRAAAFRALAKMSPMDVQVLSEPFQEVILG